jgi:hypothetical protein
MKKPVNNARKMTRVVKKKVALVPQGPQININNDMPLLEHASENAAPPEVHPLLLSAEHARVCQQLMNDLSSTSTVCWLDFASALLRDHYLKLMKPQLQHRHPHLAELSADQSLLELINQLVKGITLEQAMKTRIPGQTKKVLLIPGPEQLGQDSWDLLFTLARDFPALNIAYLLCWSEPHQQSGQMLKSLRAMSSVYAFGTISTAASALIEHLEAEAGMGATRLEELRAVLASMVE